MTFMQWVGEKLHGPRSDSFREAVDATDDATMRVRSLREQLKPYSLEIDPFIAMIRSRLLADHYAARDGDGSV